MVTVESLKFKTQFCCVLFLLMRKNVEHLSSIRPFIVSVSFKKQETTSMYLYLSYTRFLNFYCIPSISFSIFKSRKFAKSNGARSVEYGECFNIWNPKTAISTCMTVSTNYSKFKTDDRIKSYSVSLQNIFSNLFYLPFQRYFLQCETNK